LLIGCDFDGVIRKIGGFPRKAEFWDDPPVKDAVEAINHIVNEGHKVYILTARKKKWHPQIKKWCIRYGLPPLEVTNIKKDNTQLIIDDRAIRFDNNWLSISKLLT